ncbi:MAG: hypothetical protein AB7F65_00415 [Dehalococcoidia bacterium]
MAMIARNSVRREFMRTRSAAVVAVAVGVLAALSAVGDATAQTESAAGTGSSEAFVIRLVDLLPNDPRAVEDRTRSGTISAVVDGVSCASVDASAAEPPALVLGTPEQPEPCGRAGATVALFNGDRQELFIHFTVAPGETVEFGNYAPMPADTGSPLPADAGDGLPVTSGAISAAALLLACMGLVLLGIGRFASSRS